MGKTKSSVEFINGWKITHTYPEMTEEERKIFQDEIIIKLHKLFSQHDTPLT